MQMKPPTTPIDIQPIRHKMQRFFYIPSFSEPLLNIRLPVLGLLFALSGPLFTSVASANDAAPFNRDPSQLHLASGSAMVIDLQTDKVLYSSNPDVIVPIASVTKLMTAMVTLDAKLPMDEFIPVDISKTAEMKGVFKLGSELSRHDMLLIALMSSENRAAATLAHSYPGGYQAFILAMNAKAKALGMAHTVYVEPTGLSIYNVSTARDLTKLVIAARKYPMLSELSTTQEKTVTFRKPTYSLGFSNTDHLVRKSNWDIKLTKTGFTNQAGHCLVLLTTMANRPVSVVILDAFGKYTHFADASRLRLWLETGKSGAAPEVALQYKKEKNLVMKQSGLQVKE
jgi:D-alanyl-D-alanine endopeptidase (penicillin-binding protein 7)